MREPLHRDELRAVRAVVDDVKRELRDEGVPFDENVKMGIMIEMPSAALTADLLAQEGISVEVIDPRTLVPLDKATILASVAKTGRLVVADETHRSCGVAAEISALVAEEAFGDLRAPILRVTRPDLPTPFSRPLEEAVTPTAAMIATAVRKVVKS